MPNTNPNPRMKACAALDYRHECIDIVRSRNNVCFIETTNGELFIMTSCEILPDTVLFLDYGNRYWFPVFILKPWASKNASIEMFLPVYRAICDRIQCTLTTVSGSGRWSVYDMFLRVHSVFYYFCRDPCGAAAKVGYNDDDDGVGVGVGAFFESGGQNLCESGATMASHISAFQHLVLTVSNAIDSRFVLVPENSMTDIRSDTSQHYILDLIKDVFCQNFRREILADQDRRDFPSKIFQNYGSQGRMKEGSVNGVRYDDHQPGFIRPQNARFFRLGDAAKVHATATNTHSATIASATANHEYHVGTKIASPQLFPNKAIIDYNCGYGHRHHVAETPQNRMMREFAARIGFSKPSIGSVALSTRGPP